MDSSDCLSGVIPVNFVEIISFGAHVLPTFAFNKIQPSVREDQESWLIFPLGCYFVGEDVEGVVLRVGELQLFFKVLLPRLCHLASEDSLNLKSRRFFINVERNRESFFVHRLCCTVELHVKSIVELFVFLNLFNCPI